MKTLGYEKDFLEKNGGSLTAKEIEQQPELWDETIKILEDNFSKLEEFIKKIDLKNRKVIFTGAGTSEFVGKILAPYLREETGFDFESRPTTDIVACPQACIPSDKNILLVSFARSGNSPESVAAVQVAENISDKIFHLFITCNPNGKLAQMKLKNSFTLFMPKNSNDLGFAMTGSFSCMLLSASVIFNLEKFSTIKAETKKLVEQTKENTIFLRSTIENISNFDMERIVFLGSGAFEGLAQELSLKVLELCSGKIVSIYNTTLGFRHGPKSIINPKTAVVLLISQNDYTKKYDLDLLKELINDKKSLAIISVDADDSNEGINISTKFKSDNSILLGLSYLVPLQTFAFMKSLQQNVTPDNPCPSGEVNRVVKGVIIHEYNR